MNNTKNILLIAIITSTLILGTSVIPMQSYAGENKNTKDSKSSVKASAASDKNDASQHSGQDNFCYRSDDCQQANRGQQIIGKNNEATGFNDQSGNFQSTPATTGAAGGTGNNGNNGDGTTPTPPTTGTLNVCKTVIDNTGSGTLPSAFTFTFTSDGADPAEFTGRADCTTVTLPAGQYNFGESIGTEPPSSFITVSVSGNCVQDSVTTFHGSINAGETQSCTVTNTFTRIIG